MAQKTMKIDEDLMVTLQKIKVGYLERYHRTLSISEIVRLLLEQDRLVLGIAKSIEG